jgi:membrane-bound serine protease (ClpP class)
MAHVGPHEIIEYKQSWLDAIIAFLLNPVVNGILLLVILGGIYFEFQHPGMVSNYCCRSSCNSLLRSLIFTSMAAEHWKYSSAFMGLFFCYKNYARFGLPE